MQPKKNLIFKINFTFSVKKATTNKQKRNTEIAGTLILF